jgi:hypothetical protein
MCDIFVNNKIYLYKLLLKNEPKLNKNTVNPLKTPFPKCPSFVVGKKVSKYRKSNNLSLEKRSSNFFAGSIYSFVYNIS